MEIGVQSKHRKTQYVAWSILPLVVAMAYPFMTGPYAYEQMLAETSALIGMPVVPVLSCVTLFSFLHWLRRTSAAEPALILSLLVHMILPGADFAQNTEIVLSGVSEQVKWWPLIAVGAIQLREFLRNVGSRRFIAMGFSLTAVLSGLGYREFAILGGPVAWIQPLTLIVVFAAFFFNDQFAKQLRVGVLICTWGISIAALPVYRLFDVEHILMFGVTAIWSGVALLFWYDFRGRVWLWAAIAMTTVTSAIGLDSSYRVITDSAGSGAANVVGLGIVCFLIGGAISAHKAGALQILYRQVDRWSVTPPKRTLFRR
ncbi:MAG: hypothetical protein ACI9HK_004800 [Pirellulaceae bacterium]|jgi:hypothetical protein